MKYGSGHNNIAVWQNFHFPRIWFDFQISLRDFLFGTSWYKVRTRETYDGHLSIWLHIGFLTLEIIYFYGKYSG